MVRGQGDAAVPGRHARKTKAGPGYDVAVEVKNLGTGTMPVEVAATAGERWIKPKGGDFTAVSKPDPKYRESRGTVTLAAGASQTLTLHCAFAPEKVVVDPDVRVLQLQRKQAVATL